MCATNVNLRRYGWAVRDDLISIINPALRYGPALGSARNLLSSREKFYNLKYLLRNRVSRVNMRINMKHSTQPTRRRFLRDFGCVHGAIRLRQHDRDMETSILFADKVRISTITVIVFRSSAYAWQVRFRDTVERIFEAAQKTRRTAFISGPICFRSGSIFLSASISKREPV